MAGRRSSRAVGLALEAINFQPTGNGTAAIAGDFVLVASEVNSVLRAFRENGIEVTAIHNHMLNDEPRLFFMHFLGRTTTQPSWRVVSRPHSMPPMSRGAEHDLKKSLPRSPEEHRPA